MKISITANKAKNPNDFSILLYPEISIWKDKTKINNVKKVLLAIEPGKGAGIELMIETSNGKEYFSIKDICIETVDKLKLKESSIIEPKPKEIKTENIS